MKDSGAIRCIGIVEINDITDPEQKMELLKKNAIHDGNMVYNLAKCLIGQDSSNLSSIGWLALGDGGSEVASTGSITYRLTNTERTRNILADLHNRVYQKNITDEGFTMEVSEQQHPTAIADIKMSFILNQGEPFGQLPTDNAMEFNDTFTFDELGLFTNTPSLEDSYMLTHIVFHPIQKSLNRKFEIKYTIRLEIV